MPPTIAYFDCFSGASGDMLVGSLLDAGLSLGDLERDLGRLHLRGYRLEAERVTRRGLTGTHLRVHTDPGARPARTIGAIQKIVSDSGLAETVKARSLAVFFRLGRAEAAVHGVPLEDVHFHEIGAIDTLVDVIGFVCALERLGVDAVYCSSLPLGSGTIHTEHGLLPVPAPATLSLLAEVGAPTVAGQAETEMLTPTGAALLTEFAAFARPPMHVRAVGYGFGTKEFAWPNALRVWLGDALQPAYEAESDDVALLACNLDDATGQTLGYTMERLLAAGALDVWFTPIQMKKNRPAVQLSVLSRPEDSDLLIDVVLRETTTLGVRTQVLRRSKAQREIRTVDTPWGPVQVKVKLLGGLHHSVTPEYDDCARLALGAGVPLQTVMDAARAAAAP